MDVVPDVDFSVFGAAALDAEPFQATEEQQAVGEQLREILRGHGFVYAFGLLSSAEIAEAFHGAKGFWAPDVDRAALPRLTPETNVGYGGLGNEALNARRQADLKEAFNLRKVSLTDGSLPAVKDFPSYCQRTWALTSLAAQRALLAFGVALQLEDPKHFARSVVQWDLCTMRLLHYPPGIAHCDEGSGSAIACGEHTDFGAVTVLLVEDGVRGLEVRTPDGKWISAPGKEGAVVLNTGAMLARWCNDFVKATPHRVISTEEDRYSIVFFCDPDRGEVLDPLPGFTRVDAKKYGPITAEEYLRQCLNGSLKGQVSEEAKKSLEI
ncbi:unnamed protein product [Durusdinium trenchii]|uniref:Fe2OG dioxygenase domain-containing protein n=1 Tax=Durusdinium trenchii TaxID=1381693 RepID=A0ABP0I2G9_9DINO